MKSLKVAKMNIHDIKRSAIIYYAVITVMFTIFSIANSMEDASIYISGLEFITIIFLFICGLNSFKSNFYFAKSNGVSRKSFIIGLLISSIPLAFMMSVIDILINRISNIFISNPTCYDMAYGNLVGKMNYVYEGMWSQSNSFSTIINTLLFQFSFCLIAYILGIVINMIYYRANIYAKIIISAVPILLMVFGSNFMYHNPVIASKIYKFNNYIFGFEPLNVFACITTYLVASIVLSVIAFLLIRKAIIKER